MCFHNSLPKADSATRKAFSRFAHVVFQTQALVESGLCIDVDRAAGIAAAVAHLFERGRRRIALVINSVPDPLMQDRLRGYRQGLKRAKVCYDKGLVLAGPGVFPPPAEVVSAALDRVLARGNADAIVASNDVWAKVLIKAIRRRGVRVPQDVGVIGFDNLPAAELFGPGVDQHRSEQWRLGRGGGGSAPYLPRWPRDSSFAAPPGGDTPALHMRINLKPRIS